MRRFILALLALSSLAGWETSGANEAVFRPGIGGANVTLADGRIRNGLVVDEFVNVDLEREYVETSYLITNPSGRVVDLPMAFPVTRLSERDDCQDLDGDAAAYGGAEQTSLAQFFDFAVSLNRQKLEARYLPANGGGTRSATNQLMPMACAYYTFAVALKPGQSELTIRHRLIADYDGADGYGDTWEYIYPIWPARSWVKSFRVAKWRIVLPKRFSERVLIDSGKFHNVDGEHHLDFQVKAPGERLVRGNEYLFTATDFAPDREVKILLRKRDEAGLVVGCAEKDLPRCWKKSLASFMEIRAYHGAERCYEGRDLVSIVVNRGEDVETLDAYPETIPYLRAEIYARHGYRFANEESRAFFGAMQWYFPTQDNVELNEFERFNVKYLKEAEKTLRQDETGPGISESEALARERAALCRKREE